MTRLLSLPLCGLLLLQGCSTQPADTVTGSPTPAQASTAPANAHSYDSAELADLLVAEVAAQRQAYGVTLGYYTEVAKSTGDPQLLSQASQLAHYLEDHHQALLLSQQRLEQDPENEEALQLAILSEIRLGNTDAATHYLDTLLGAHGEQALGRLVAKARGLDAEGNLQLVQALAQLTDQYPEQAPLWYARALWQEREGKLEAALDANEEALKRMPRHEDALLLKAQLLYKLGEPNQALRHLKKIVRKYPNSRRARITYVRMLLATGEIKQAEKQLTIMAERNPDDLDLKFSLALLALEAGATDTARDQLQQLLAINYRPDDVHLYLAQGEEQQANLDAAIDHYLKVGGPQAVRARVQAARLLSRQGQLEQAHALLNSLKLQHPEMATSLTLSEAEMLNSNGHSQKARELLSDALENDPDNTELRYSRAMMAEKADDLAQLEADLKHILSLNPDDPSALNALGYTLADRTTRLDEAHRYVSRALELSPDDPAILDSMGWVLYRQGKLKEARNFLRRAYEKFPDPEVAAHYGEVLWVMGAQNQAREVWRDTLNSNPDAAHVRETMERLGARL
ncbi:tetratricopeptide repeat protein [Alcanivorax sediminis]|uniref:Tetratricopeptide repeat protein n=1 Tax=Alcanivorax sediminis TaxID=2663008 RepID=A0A6N7LX92_9GAMM|nr:tetratricopeptide repeat protein [Alcanivorax sediminis]MQX54893.1 tetratricopeptide repeat protein [Alcanivorax sediminis]